MIKDKASIGPANQFQMEQIDQVESHTRPGNEANSMGPLQY